MKNHIITCIVFISIIGTSYSQICEPSSKPTPHLGAHPGLEFSNLWNQINVGGPNGEYGSANFANKPDGYNCVYIGTDGCPKAGMVHAFGFDLTPRKAKHLKFQW